MSSRTEVFRAKAEMCRVQAALRGDTPVGRRWLKLSQQWSEMAEKAKEPSQLTPAMDNEMAANLGGSSQRAVRLNVGTLGGFSQGVWSGSVACTATKKGADPGHASARRDARRHIVPPTSLSKKQNLTGFGGSPTRGSHEIAFRNSVRWPSRLVAPTAESAALIKV